MGCFGRAPIVKIGEIKGSPFTICAVCTFMKMVVVICHALTDVNFLCPYFTGLPHRCLTPSPKLSPMKIKRAKKSKSKSVSFWKINLKESDAFGVYNYTHGLTLLETLLNVE